MKEFLNSHLIKFRFWTSSLHIVIYFWSQVGLFNRKRFIIRWSNWFCSYLINKSWAKFLLQNNWFVLSGFIFFKKIWTSTSYDSNFCLFFINWNFILDTFSQLRLWESFGSHTIHFWRKNPFLIPAILQLLASICYFLLNLRYLQIYCGLELLILLMAEIDFIRRNRINCRNIWKRSSRSHIGLARGTLLQSSLFFDSFKSFSQCQIKLYMFRIGYVIHMFINFSCQIFIKFWFHPSHDTFGASKWLPGFVYWWLSGFVYW